MNQPPQNRQKVLFLITKATWGGAQKYVYDLATNLPKNRIAVALAYGDKGKLSYQLKEHGIATYHLSALSRDVSLVSDIQSFFQLLQIIRQVRPDVLHVNSSKAAALGALVGRLLRVRKIIFTAHGWPFKENRNSIARAAIYCISWFTAFLSHATIVVSRTDEQIGKRMWFVGNKIHYIPLSIVPPQFLSREEATEKLHITTQLPRIVSIGELTKNKGHRFGIDAIAALKKRNIPCQYFVIGTGELREELERYAIEQQVENDVVFCGFVENASQYLKAFDVFLLPSIKEGMPYVLLEAAAAGLPIVASNVIDAAFKEQHPNTKLVPAGNAATLSEALKRAIEDRSEQSRVQDETLSQMIERTTNLY